MAWNELQRDLGFAAGLLCRRPFQILVQVTNRCNMKCGFCGFWSKAASPAEELSLEDFRRFEKQLSDLGKCIVSLEGGEPFLRPDLADIVRVFGARHLPFVFTNGWHVTEESARALFDAGLVQVGVSIDYPDADRHDRRRGLPNAFDRAWRAVDVLRDAAPRGGRQVHVLTVIMEDNRRDLEELLKLSAAHGVGHCVTLLSPGGSRRAAGAAMPPAEISGHLLELWRRYPHFRIFREYLELMDAYLAGGDVPACRAGSQSFNVDHLGNVSPCIERIGEAAGNIRKERLADILARMSGEPGTCRDCWTVCRSFSQFLGAGGSLKGWMDLTFRMRST